MTRTIKAVLFDLDGTLRDTQDIIVSAIQQTILGQTGKHFSRAEMEPYIHYHREVYKGLVGEDGLDEFDRTYTARIDELIPKAELFAGVDQAIRELHVAGYRLALVSTAKTGAQYLREHGLHEHFDVIVGAQDVTRIKPNPEPVQVALDRLGVTADAAVMVGDMKVDMIAAKDAHVPYRIGITYGFGTPEQLTAAGATQLIDSLAELPGILRDIT